MARALLVLLALFASAPVAAQEFAGTWTAKNPNGTTVTLMLKEGEKGKFTGTLSGEGMSLSVEADHRPPNLVGMVTGDRGMLFLVAVFEGEQLHVVLAEPRADGQPNWQRTQQSVMTRAKPL